MRNGHQLLGSNPRDIICDMTRIFGMAQMVQMSDYFLTGLYNGVSNVLGDVRETYIFDMPMTKMGMAIPWDGTLMMKNTIYDDMMEMVYLGIWIVTIASLKLVWIAMKMVLQTRTVMTMIICWEEILMTVMEMVSYLMKIVTIVITS